MTVGIYQGGRGIHAFRGGRTAATECIITPLHGHIVRQESSSVEESALVRLLAGIKSIKI